MLAVTLLLDRDLRLGAPGGVCLRARRFVTDRHGPTATNHAISAQLWVGVAGLAGMVVSRGRSVERSRWAGSHIRCRLRLWLGFRTTCPLAGASPWRGS